MNPIQLDLFICLFFIFRPWPTAGQFLRSEQQRVRAKGILRCKVEPRFANGQTVKLMDGDRASNDDEMAIAQTDASGNFELSGNATDSLVHPNIEPYLTIHTHCNKKFRKTDPTCFREIKIPIAAEYINSNKPFTVDVDLSAPMKNEKKQCFTGNIIDNEMREHLNATWKDFVDKNGGRMGMLQKLVDWVGKPLVTAIINAAFQTRSSDPD